MAQDKLLAEWFWTDRWMGSSGFLLPMLARGVYREMLTQAWRRGAKLPNDPASIKRAIGATDAEWTEAWPLVSKYWRSDNSGHLVNDTQLAVYAESKESADLNHERAVKGAQARWKQGLSNAQASTQAKPEKCPPSPSPSPSLISVSISDSEKKRTIAPTALLSADADFEAFRQEYPTSRRVGGKLALRAWYTATKGRNGTHLELMRAALEQHKRSEQWQTPKLIPLMTTWLNQERWNQTLPEPKGFGVTAKTAGNAAALQRFVDKHR